jgi:hypothetical protein
MTKSRRIPLLLLCSVVLTPMWFPSLVLGDPPQLPAPKHSEYRIAIHCSGKTLQVWRGTKMIREYPVEIGAGTVKRRSGDHRTPLGDYEISWMASRNSAKGYRIKDGKSWCKENRFVYAKHGPPLEKLWTTAYGGDRATVISINYPNAKDLSMGRTGSCIHIHADARLKRGALRRSCGCIHMFPKDAEELYELVDVGSPVKILP